MTQTQPTRTVKLQGDFIRENLPGILEFIANSGTTGELRLRGEHETAGIHFHQGTVIHATHGPLSGDQAFYRALNTPSGSFQLLDDPTPHPRSITTPLPKLLLDGVFWQDTHDTGLNPALVPHKRARPAGPVWIDEPQWAFLALVDGTKNLASLTRTLGWDLVDRSVVIQQLVTDGVIDLRDPSTRYVGSAFLEDVRVRVAALVGPFAKIVVQDAGKVLKKEPADLTVADVPAFLHAVRDHLPVPKRPAFEALIPPLQAQYTQEEHA